MTDTYGAKHKRLTSSTRTIIFQRENLNYLIVCITQCTLFFQYVCFLWPICLPCVICGNVCNETSRPSDNGLRNVHKNHVLAKQNRSPRQ